MDVSLSYVVWLAFTDCTKKELLWWHEGMKEDRGVGRMAKQRRGRGARDKLDDDNTFYSKGKIGSVTAP